MQWEATKTNLITTNHSHLTLSSELNELYKGFKFIDNASNLALRDTWILTKIHASLQQLSRCTTAGDMSSLSALDAVVRLSSRDYIYFQWVPSHIGFNGNEITDSLAKSTTSDALRGDACLTFAELPSIKMMELNALWRVPPAHAWH
ncbi:autophagy protein 5 [Trichonephila clavipes]|nr:autophagy protein 5 [Trichonephila clavipes]